MGFYAENQSLVMHLPALFERYCIPKHNDPCHPHNIVGKKHEIAFLGSIKLGLNEKEACDFHEDLLCDWATHVSPGTVGDYLDSTLLLPKILLAQNATTT